MWTSGFNFWAWLTIMCIANFVVMVKNKLSTGKFLSMPIRKRIKFAMRLPFFFRLSQLWIIGFILGFWFSSNDPKGETIDSILCLLLYVDDYYSDDNKWKRFKSWAKNNIKWKMVLPQTEEAR